VYALQKLIVAEKSGQLIFQYLNGTFRRQPVMGHWTLHLNGNNEPIINSALSLVNLFSIQSLAQQSTTSSVVINNTVNDARKTGNTQLSKSSSFDHTSTAANNLEDMGETIITNNGE